MNLKIVFIASAALFYHQSFALNISSSGSKAYTCDGPLIMNNDKVTCNGIDISNKKQSPKRECESEVRTKCGYEKVSVHANGGGTVSRCVHRVSPEAFIDSTSVVCGKVTIEADVEVKTGSMISGRVEIYGESVVSNSNLSGRIYLESVEVSSSSLSGDAEIYNSILIKTNKSGSGYVQNSNITESFILGRGDIKDSSLIHVNKSGSGDVVKSTLAHRTLSGSKDIKNQR